MSRGVEQRIAWFRTHLPRNGEGQVAVGQCLRHTWLATDLPAAGKADANAGAAYVMANNKMKRSGDPPRGAWVWWRSSTHGHVALSLGHHRILSTDVSGPATVGVVPLHYISDVWRHEYVGWSDWYVESFEVGNGDNMQMSAQEREEFVNDVADAMVKRMFGEHIYGDEANRDDQGVTFRESTRAGYRHATK